MGILGGLLPAFYGMVATWQSAGFGRLYAADRYDIMGALIALLGVTIIFYAPGTGEHDPILIFPAGKDFELSFS